MNVLYPRLSGNVLFIICYTLSMQLAEGSIPELKRTRKVSGADEAHGGVRR